MNTILYGFKLGIGLVLAYGVFNLIGQILTLIISKILIYRLKKAMTISKPKDLNYGKREVK